jgi:solute carrier family 45 protein 1/2/4
MLLFTLLTFSTFFITTVAPATVMISLVGICWAVACWVPFAIIMEFLKELDSPRQGTERLSNGPAIRPMYGVHGRTISSASMMIRDSNTERQPLLRRRSFDEFDARDDQTKPVAGGTVLGIHNLAIVFPQFFIAIASSVVFRIVDGVTTEEGAYLGKNGVAWVLRFGGLCTLIGALISRMVAPTPTEKEMRRRLGEIRELQRDQSDSSP